eukprot:15794642-Heterocapsa_arctica.AAC.1
MAGESSVGIGEGGVGPSVEICRACCFEWKSISDENQYGFIEKIAQPPQRGNPHGCFSDPSLGQGQATSYRRLFPLPWQSDEDLSLRRPLPPTPRVWESSCLHDC